MKLLFISYHYLPDLSAGSFRVNALLNEGTILKKKNDEIELICSTPNRNNLDINTVRENSLLFKITRISVPNIGNTQIAETIKFIIFSFKVLIFCHSKKPDIIFATSSKLMTGVLAALISKIKSVKLYLDIRDIFVESLESTGSKFNLIIFLPIIKFLERFSVNQAAKVNLVSYGFKSYFEKKYPHKVFSFHTNGIDTEYLEKFTSKKIKSEIDFNHKDKITILYAGNIGVGQGLEKIIPQLAIKLENNVQFIVIGKGTKKRTLSNLITAKKIENVEILEPLEREKLFEFYALADVLFLHLDNKDAFERVLPSKIFEYASTGLPIFAGVSGYAKKFLSEEVANVFIFKPSDVNSAILSFKTLKLITVNRDNFISKYSRKKISKDLFKDILSIN